MKKDYENYPKDDMSDDWLSNVLAGLGQEEIELKNDLYAFEYINLYAKFLNASPAQRKEYIHTFITDIKSIIYKYFDDYNKDNFSAKLHKIKAEHNPNISVILEISCPDEKVMTLARTIYLCFNPDYSEFRYFTVEYTEGMTSDDKYYILGEKIADEHFGYGKIEPNENEIDLILSMIDEPF